jgi:raffinose/stachyose/melibiose transport system permease protein
MIKEKIETVVKYLICIIFAFIILIPIGTAVLGGFKTLGQLRTDPYGWPDPFLWQQYWDIITSASSPFGKYFFNSFFIMTFTVILDLTLAALAGFALARFQFPGRSLVFNYFLLGLLFPLAVAILPLYIQLRSLNLIDNYFGVIFPQVAFNLPWHIMLFRGFFAAIPKELEDACAIDGYGSFGFFLYIVIPLSRPAIATVGVLTMVNSWNNFFLPLLVINKNSLFTLPMGVMDYQGQYQVNWNLIMAFVSLALIPAVIFYIFAQKHIIAGLTGGSLKG